MLNNLNIKLIQHKDGSENLYKQIAEIKSHHWHYPIEEHLRWMNENINPDDFHLLISDEGVIVAYMNMVCRKVEALGEERILLGIGNVCVHTDYLKHKLGILLMDAGKFYLNTLEKTGILFCKDHLVPFYLKAGWKLYNGEVLCNNSILQENTLFSNTFFSNIPLIKIESTF